MPQQYGTPGGAIVDAIISTLAAREAQRTEAQRLAQQRAESEVRQQQAAATLDLQRAQVDLQRQQIADTSADREAQRARQAQQDRLALSERLIDTLAPGQPVTPQEMALGREGGFGALFRETPPAVLDMVPTGPPTAPLDQMTGTPVPRVPGVMAFAGTPQQRAAMAATERSDADAAAREQAIAAFLERLPPAARLQAQGQQLGLPVNADLIQPPAPEAHDPPDQQWVIRDGQVTPIVRGTARPGDMPYDEKRTSQIDDPDDARQVTQTALDVATRLKDHPGLGAATGAYELRGFTQGAVDFNALRDQLVAALSLPNLGALKGPMSDKDVLFIKQISTRLSERKLSKEETVTAINEAIAFLRGKLGGAAPARSSRITSITRVD